MPRANRHYIPGYVWHITHRCHKKEFLLKFARDRRRWLEWLFEAKKRYGLSILNYMVTSNHLLVRDNRERDVIPKSIQLIAGRTGQEFNQRKSRKGAFWEDRYHATAIETDQHLIQCMVYIDMNMVRTGVIHHPSGWPFSGYNEIQQPRKRYALIDYRGLMELLNFGTMDHFIGAYGGWVEKSLNDGNPVRDGKWSESVAVGSREFVERTKERLGIRAKGREVLKAGDGYELREPAAPYEANSGHENADLRMQNAYSWSSYPEISEG